MQPSNVRIICNTVGSTIANTGLALITVSILFMISDTTTLAKQTVVHLPDLIANVDIASLKSDFTLTGFAIICGVFLVGTGLRIAGLCLSSTHFISRIENLWSTNNTKYIPPIATLSPRIETDRDMIDSAMDTDAED